MTETAYQALYKYWSIQGYYRIEHCARASAQSNCEILHSRVSTTRKEDRDIEGEG